MITIIKKRINSKNVCDSCSFNEPLRPATFTEITFVNSQKTAIICNACLENLAGAIDFIVTTLPDVEVKI